MEHPFRNQKKAKAEVGNGSFIIFANKGETVLNSATVTKREGNTITVDYGEECEPRTETLHLENVTLYYGPDWDIPDWETSDVTD